MRETTVIILAACVLISNMAIAIFGRQMLMRMIVVDTLKWQTSIWARQVLRLIKEVEK